MRIRIAAAMAIAALSLPVRPLARSQTAPAPVEGSFVIHMILHAIGVERVTLVSNADGTRTLSTTFQYMDRNRPTKSVAVLTTTADERPRTLAVTESGAASLTIAGGTATMVVGGVTETKPVPDALAAVVGPSPFALQWMMMRAWHARGEPKALELVSGEAKPEPLQIARVGQDTITVAGKTTRLDRYTVNHLMFGREILWMTPGFDLAAAMTFAGGLPLEAVRTEFEPALPDLYRAGVAQELADFAALGRAVPPTATGSFAITGATLIDATGASPVPDAVVIVRDARIAAVGPRATTPVPSGMRTIDGRGQTLLPGLWEMHTHASGVEFGPATLAAGITTARDCGGEFDYLVADRDAIDKDRLPGPCWLLAGLVDSGRLQGVWPRHGRHAGRRPCGRRSVPRAAGFPQMKLYTYLTPDVVKAIAAEAHRLGMTVTGHVPQSLTTKAGIEAGMDQINHLNYVTSMLRPPPAPGQAPVARGTGAPGQANPLDLQSTYAQDAIKFLLAHHTVVDPTASWGEMASHSKEVDLASFEPGILTAPAVLDAKFRGMTNASTADQMHARLAQTEAVIRALYQAGVTIVPGSDTGLVGFGLHRELEIYAEAGLTPMEVIQAATIVSARAMGLDKDTGTIEVGKRADLILVAGDPLAEIKVLRQVSEVVTNGRVYSAAALWRSVEFKAPSAAGAR